MDIETKKRKIRKILEEYASDEGIDAKIRFTDSPVSKTRDRLSFGLRPILIELPNHLLEDFTVDQFVGEGLHEIAHHKYYHKLKRTFPFVLILTGSLIGGFILILFSFPFLFSVLPTMVSNIIVLAALASLFVVSPLLAFNLPPYLTKNMEIQADEYAALRVGIETYLSTFQKDWRGVEPTIWDRLRNFFTFLPSHPSTEDRIDHFEKILTRKDKSNRKS